MTEPANRKTQTDCPDVATLRRYYEGKLDTQMTETVRVHLASCEACEQAEGAQATDDELETLLREAETDLAPDIRRRILESARRARDEHLSGEDGRD
jgi:predicted anti-sigma-YlaC factor YlaD